MLHRLSPPALIFALLPGLLPALSGAEPIAVRAAPVSLNPRDPGQRTVGRLRYLGGLHLTSDDPHFGGYSCLRLGHDGSTILAVSDEGRWMTARLVHDKAGVLVGVEAAESGSLLGLEGKPLEGKDSRDSESCVFLSDGSLAVGFEREHRLWRYPVHDGKPDGVPIALPSPPGVAGAPFNGGIEALLDLGKQGLLALTEYWVESELIVAWMHGPGDWQPLGYRFERALRPSDACLLPNGDVVVLERAYNPDRGIVGVRLRQVPRDALRPGAAVGGRLIADVQPPLTLDNFEGIDCRKGPHGRTIFYLISDNNFNAEQRTLLLAFALDRR